LKLTVGKAVREVPEKVAHRGLDTENLVRYEIAMARDANDQRACRRVVIVYVLRRGNHGGKDTVMKRPP
jgi:hypothetical protein